MTDENRGLADYRTLVAAMFRAVELALEGARDVLDGLRLRVHAQRTAMDPEFMEWAQQTVPTLDEKFFLEHGETAEDVQVFIKQEGLRS